MKLNKFIGDRIKRFRESRGMTQDSLAQKLNTTRQSISRYESGERKANQDLLFELAELFNVKVDDFFPPRNLDGNPTDSNPEECQNPDTWVYDYYDTDVAAGDLCPVAGINKYEVKELEVADSIMGRYAGQGNIFFTRVNGKSMDKSIPDQSLIAVRKLESFYDYNDDDIVLFAYDNGYSIKRFYNDEKSEQLVFSPESTFRGFHDIVVPYEDADELKLVGKVILYIVNLE